MDHGEPVTQVLLLPGGGTMLTAGGNYVRLWDVVGGGRCLHTFSNHQKLITTMCLDGTGTRLLTGSLDGLVKVYEVSTFGVTHTMRYDAPILSMAISPDNSRLIVGCTDDTLTIKQRMVKVSELVTERKSARLLRGGTYRYFLRGQSTAAAVDDIRINKDRKPKLQAYDQSLKHFQYADALDTALASHDPIVISSLLEELIARDGLLIATGGRTEESLEPLLAFLVKYVAEPRFASLLLDVANGMWSSAHARSCACVALLQRGAPLQRCVAPCSRALPCLLAVVVDQYASVLGASATVDALFMRLHGTLMREARMGKELLGLQGALDLLMAASTTGSGEVPLTAA
ncbi:hypothetical protein EON66_09020 [archaeon]|nr:MAG: hypothetical protein EON66_09020 [archaeon]